MAGRGDLEGISYLISPPLSLLWTTDGDLAFSVAFAISR
jgi:hypothetical protein